MSALVGLVGSFGLLVIVAAVAQFSVARSESQQRVAARDRARAAVPVTPKLATPARRCDSVSTPTPTPTPAPAPAAEVHQQPETGALAVVVPKPASESDGLAAPAPALQLVAPQSGAWACCFLRVVGPGSGQLAGVPVASVAGAVSRLAALGASGVVVQSLPGCPLCVVQFAGSPLVFQRLATRFPVACAI